MTIATTPSLPEPGAPGRAMTTIVLVATLGGLLSGYDTGVINGALAPMSVELGLTPLTEGWVTSSLLLGAALGAIAAGPLADRIGRRPTIRWVATIFLVGALACVAAPDAGTMIAARAALGIAVGGASVTVPVLLAELAPAARRGRLAGRNELMIVIGQLAAFTMNAVIGTVWGAEDGVWRIMLSVAALPAIGLLVGMSRVPESPRWLVAAGREPEALTVLRRIRDEDQAEAELDEIRTLAVERSTASSAITALLQPRALRILLIGIGVAVGQQLTGINAIQYYGQSVLREGGFDADGALVANILPGAIGVAGTLLGLRLMDRLPRRTMLLAGFALTSCMHLLLAAASAALPDDLAARPFVILALVVLFVGSMQTFLNVTTWVVLSELFPLRIRGIGIGIAVLCMWIANAGISLGFPSLIDGAGFTTTFLIFGCVDALVLVFVATSVPETGGRSLEAIELRMCEGAPTR